MYRECESALDDIMNSGQKIFYKFTKSSEEYVKNEIFYENAYLKYGDFSIVNACNSYGLSFCGRPEKILACAIYGDTLTQVIVDKDIAEDLNNDNYTYGFSREWRLYGEITAQKLYIGKQFSISNPEVIKECMKIADVDSVRTFFDSRIIQGSPVEEMYEKLGFSESKHIVETMRPYYREYLMFGRNEIDSFRTKLEELFPTKEGDFSFSKEEQYYEQNKEAEQQKFAMQKSKEKENELFDSLDKQKPKRVGGFLSLVNKLRRKEQEKENTEQDLNDEEIYK